MSRINLRTLHCLALQVLLLVSLAGCGWVMPLHLPDYTLGPVSSDQLSDLVQDVVPAEEGEIQVFGQASIMLLDNRYSFRSVAAVTASSFLFLNFHQASGRYEIVGRLPFEDILSVTTIAGAPGRPIWLQIKGNELSLGDRKFSGGTSYQPLVFEFIKPGSMFIDKEKHEAVLILLQDKIQRQEEHQAPDDPSQDFMN